MLPAALIFPRIAIYSPAGVRPIEFRLEEFIFPILLLVHVKFLARFISVVPKVWLGFAGLLIVNGIRHDQMTSIFAAIKEIEYFMCFSAAAIISVDADDIRFYRKTVHCTIIGIALWFIYQRIFDDINGVRLMTSLIGFDLFYQLSGMWSGKVNYGRGTLPFDLEPSNVTGFAIIACAFSLSRALQKKRRLPGVYTGGASIVEYLMSVLAVAISVSRGTLVVVFTQTVAFLAYICSRSTRIALMLAVLLILAVGANYKVAFELFLNYAPYLIRELGITDLSYSVGDSGRVQVWMSKLGEYGESAPADIILGVGYRPDGWADNSYLRVLVDTGVLGFSILMGMLIFLLKRGLGILRSSNDMMLLLTSIGLAIACIPNDVIYASKIMVPLAIVIGLYFNPSFLAAQSYYDAMRMDKSASPLGKVSSL